MDTTYDCIVIGVGGFGSGALYHLAKRGLRVLGIERFQVPHDRGSSHGETRMIRKAYIEHPDYVPLVRRAYEMWRDLETEAATTLLHPCGLMLTGLPESEAIAGSKLAARQHGLAIEEVPLSEARRRWPGFRIPDRFEVMFDSEAGYLEVENCTRTHVEQAGQLGAEVHTNETVVAWESDGHRIRVRTDHSEYQAAKLVITAGAWTSNILADFKIPLEVARKPTFWHEVTTDAYDVLTGAPTNYFELPQGCFYSFPSLDGRTVKTAEHSGGDPVSDPTSIDRECRPADVEPIANFVREYLPGLRPQPIRHVICMYVRTPDEHFIVDRHPEHDNVVIGAGFSGHGYKFTTVLGEALADLAIDGRTAHPIGFLAIDRAALSQPD